jgi:hypothetical protein
VQPVSAMRGGTERIELKAGGSDGLGRAISTGAGGGNVWHVKESGAGEKRGVTGDPRARIVK